MKIIAEAGIGHNGDLVAAAKLIDTAKSAGCDFVKFQWYDTDRLFGKDFEFYQDSKQAMFGLGEFKTLFAYAIRNGITPFASVFHTDYVESAYEMGMRIFKVAVRSVTDISLLKAIADTRCDVIMSAKAIDKDLDEAVSIFNDCPLSLLYCVPKYPASFEDFDFSVMEKMADRYSVPVGISDHSQSFLAGLEAQRRGAALFEHHITLSRTDFPNCDSSSSWEPQELEMFVRTVREAEAVRV